MCVFLAQIVEESPQSKKVCFCRCLTATLEAGETPDKNNFFAADLKRKAGLGFIII